MHKNKLIKTIILVAVIIILVGGTGFGFYRYEKLQTSNNLISNTNKSINENLKNAKEAIENDKVDEANKYLEEVVKLDKDNNEVKNLKDIIEKDKSDKAVIIKKQEEEKAAILKKQEEEKAAIIKKQEEEKARIANANKTLTPEQTIEIVKKQFSQYNSNPNLHYEYDHDISHDGREFYVIHIYENVDNHTATIGWYGVDKITGRIYDEMASKYIN
jgi:hypothetical protein